jgi:hypothetical protein
MTRFRLSPTIASPLCMMALASLLLPLMLSARASFPLDLPVPTISSAIVGNAAARA